MQQNRDEAEPMKPLMTRVAGRLGPIALAICLLMPWTTPRAQPLTIDQGADWTDAARNDYYTRDQGSRVMPLAWMQALKLPNGQPFLAGSLSRYGYLPNDASPTPGLPVGFVAAGPPGSEIIGITCSACHTRQIDVGGKSYRIDGGPAIVDFQSFLADLDVAVGSVLGNDAAFADFAKTVLGPAAGLIDPSTLRDELNLWYLRYHTLIQKALPTPPWGPARLDAVAMIFNRVTGLDIGKPPSYLIAENIKPAVAPVRYPFLWNAPIQDKTQWPGFADNGNDLLGLSRNLGEVFGVFAEFHPRKDPFKLLKVNYIEQNSANFEGLAALEGLVKKLGPPKWPFAVDAALAEQGKAIYARGTAQGGCADCHGIRPGAVRFLNQQTWATPIMDVGTDSREYEILGFTAQTGELEGAQIPLRTQPLKPVDAAFNVLATSVMGSILQYTFLENPNVPDVLALLKSPQLMDMQGMFKMAAVPGYAYESRVLEGIWATAPYLHNGSVPTLAELLKPAAQRVASFKIGPAYDVENVGLAAEQTIFNYTLQTTDCSARNSGNSRCGHEYGTLLPADEKRALLEYLKTL